MTPRTVRVVTPACVATPNPVTSAWRWRYELALAAAVSIGLAALVRHPVGAWTAALGGHLLMALALTTPVRRFAVARAWCVITPHRVRRACAEARIVTRRGRLPVILRTTPGPCGERVLLYCRAGTCAEDLDDARDLLRAACWAADVLVTPDPDRSYLVTLDVIRTAST